MQTSYLKVSNTITTRTISKGLNNQGMPASNKLTKAQDKLELMLISIRLQISLRIA